MSDPLHATFYVCSDLSVKGFVHPSKFSFVDNVSNFQTEHTHLDKPISFSPPFIRHEWVHKRHLPKSRYPYQCTACNAAFIRPEVLNDHMNFHKGIRPYKCAVCPKTYSDRSALMRHRKQHELKKKREEMVEAKTVASR